ncbi:MAG: signal peptidase II [Syntrophobacteraceae bacterium]
MNRKRILAVVFALVLSMGCDQITKYMAKSHLSKTRVVSVAGSPLKLHYSENTGGQLAFE